MKLFYAFLIILFGTCTEKSVIEIKNSKGILIQRITLTGDTTKGKNGIYEKFSEEGLPIEIAHYKDGKLEGEKQIFEAGNLYSIEHHKNELYEGEYKVFYPDGKVQLESQYVNNEMTGELKAYYPSGKLKEIVHMKSNQEEGPFVEYFENGNKKAEGNYKDGAKEDGLLILYDTLGVIIRKMECKDGICHTIWTQSSTDNNLPK